MASNKQVHVAVGVILNSQQEILIALRPQHTHQGGLWEFPGGKVESDESVELALARELKEELGLIVQKCSPLIEVRHNYSDKSVLLDVWWVDSFTGLPEDRSGKGREGQDIRWISARRLDNFTFPAANQPIIDAVQQALLERV